MGTYGLSTPELVEAMAKALDDLNGDFSNEGLNKALKKMKEYPYTSDSKESPDKWQDYLNE